MNPEEYNIMYWVELSHWWYLGMAEITCSLLDNYYPANSNLHILDAGCGTGAAMSTYLSAYGQVTGVDLAVTALNYCKLRGIKNLSQASVLELPFASDSFDLVTSFDVLYEQTVRDDQLPIHEFFRTLAKGGHIFLRLPAYNWLRGQHDRAVKTARRYTVKQVTKLLLDGGFYINKITYANTLLFPLAMTKRLVERVLPPGNEYSDLAINMGSFNGCFRKTLALEAKLLKQFYLPYGLSVVAIGEKR